MRNTKTFANDKKFYELNVINDNVAQVKIIKKYVYLFKLLIIKN